MGGYDPEDDEEVDSTIDAFMGWGGGASGAANPSGGSTAPKVPSSSNAAATAPAVSGAGGQPQPVPANSGNGNATQSASSEDDLWKPIPYNPPARPAALDQLSRQQAADRDAWENLKAPNPQDYKPSGGRRALASIAGALVAAGTRNAGEGMNVGEGVLNAPYNRANAAYQTQATQAKQSMDADTSAYNQADRDFENSLTQYDRDFNAQSLNQGRAVLAADHRSLEQQRLSKIADGTEQPDDPKNPMGTWHATTVGGKRVALSGPPDSWLKTPAGTDAQRSAEADRLGLTGDKRTYYLANGKLREPAPTTNIRIPSEGYQQYEDWRGSFRREHGREPNAEEIAAYGKRSGNGAPGMTKSIADRIESQKNAAINKARIAYGNGNDPSYTLNDYLDDWQAAQDNYEDRIATATGQDVQHVNIRDHVDAKGNWIGAKASAPGANGGNSQPQQPTQPGGALPAGNGQKIDLKTAQAFLKAAGGDKDKARELARNKGWKF